MNTNKGTCIEIVPHEAPWTTKDGKQMQGYQVRFTDGGIGMVWALVGDPLPFVVGQEYSYFGYFGKNGKVKIVEATGADTIDYPKAFARVEALKLANNLMDRHPNVKYDAEGKLADIKAYGALHKMIARSYEAHILRTDEEPAKPSTNTAAVAGTTTVNDPVKSTQAAQ